MDLLVIHKIFFGDKVLVKLNPVNEKAEDVEFATSTTKTMKFR